MTETKVENQICNHCGADVRPGALFCYNCGKQLSLVTVGENNGRNENTSGARFLEESSERNANQKKLDFENPPQNEIKVQKSPLASTETITGKPAGQAVVQDAANLKSAASLRRKSKVLQRRRVEIVWEEKESAPNTWFILVAIILTILAGVIVYLALYLR